MLGEFLGYIGRPLLTIPVPLTYTYNKPMIFLKVRTKDQSILVKLKEFAVHKTFCFKVFFFIYTSVTYKISMYKV